MCAHRRTVERCSERVVALAPGCPLWFTTRSWRSCLSSVVPKQTGGQVSAAILRSQMRISLHNHAEFAWYLTPYARRVTPATSRSFTSIRSMACIVFS